MNEHRNRHLSSQPINAASATLSANWRIVIFVIAAIFFVMNAAAALVMSNGMPFQFGLLRMAIAGVGAYMLVRGSLTARYIIALYFAATSALLWFLQSDGLAGLWLDAGVSLVCAVVLLLAPRRAPSASL